VEAIAANGLSGTTMARVTGLAGLSMGIVSFHFHSKENLLRETLMSLVEEHRNCWLESFNDDTLTPAEKLIGVIEAHFNPKACTPKRIAVWFAFFGEAHYRAIYREHVSRFDVERAGVTEDLCREVLRENDIRDLDPAQIAQALECFADGLWLNMMMYPDWLSPERARALIRQMVTRTFPHLFSN
jgi:TetR/AcrR family transcriptional repressor of bet genes